MSDIGSDGDPTRQDEFAELGERLRRERRRPPPALRDSLRGALAGRAPKPRPVGLRRLVAYSLAAGGALLALGALGAAGAGPFGT